MARGSFDPRGMLMCLCVLAFVGTCSCRQQQRTTATDPAPRAPTPHTGGGTPVALRQTPIQPLQHGGHAVPAATPPNIRVAVLKDAASVRITGGKGKAVLSFAEKSLRAVPDETPIEISANPSSIVVNNLPAGEAGIVLRSADERFRINDQDVASRLRVYTVPNSMRVTVVAVIEIEEYLAGVLAGEVPYNRWHAEAMKAQAVTSRSYALYQSRKNAAEPYDVESTIMSQVFKPGFQSVPAISAATTSTRGLVLTTGQQLFPAYFHSTCGGQTAGAAGVFPDYAGVKCLCGAACPFCAPSPHHRWRWSLNKETLAEKLRAQFPNDRVTTVKTVEFFDERGAPVATGKPGRAASVRIRHASGTLTMQGNVFRLMVSPRDLKSLYFEEITDRGQAIDIAGGGFGHGVGLCQFGSHGMACAGHPYTAILGMYYPGAALTKMY